ncbi:MAG: hypothetical protein ACTHME_01385, partial [Candidatus Nitrosocosmicus sp.]
HYVDNSPSESVIKKYHDSTDSSDLIEEKKNQEYENNVIYNYDQDIQYEEKKIDNTKRRRKKIIEYND